MSESEDAPGVATGRRSLLKGAALAALGVSVVLPRAARAAVPSAAAQWPFPLPAVGVEVPMSGFAANTPLQIAGGVVTLDFKGGIRLRTTQSTPYEAQFAVVGFQFTAMSPVLGTVTLGQLDVLTHAAWMSWSRARCARAREWQ